MRDPYEILGIKRGATIDDIKAAYRRLSKQRHPDAGGSNEAMAELNIAYAAILDGLKQQYRQEESQETRERKESASQNEWREERASSASQDHRETWWRDRYREIDEELETLRRYAEQQDEQLRRMREAAWRSGQRADWARLTFDDLLRFFRLIARSGVKGLALLFSALVGVGTVLVEANVVSAVILLGSLIGVLISLAFKNDKGGMMSAAVLLFGVMTIWLPPVRQALSTYPLATISVLALLGLIYKFAREGGTVGMMTGGVFSLYVLVTILNTTAQRAEPPTAVIPIWTPSPNAQATASAQPLPVLTPNPTPTEPLTLLASDGAVLKFAAGVPYRLKVRADRTTSLQSMQGSIRRISGKNDANECVDSSRFSAQPSNSPWRTISDTFYACGGDATMLVRSIE